MSQQKIQRRKVLPLVKSGEHTYEFQKLRNYDAFRIQHMIAAIVAPLLADTVVKGFGSKDKTLQEILNSESSKITLSDISKNVNVSDLVKKAFDALPFEDFKMIADIVLDEAAIDGVLISDIDEAVIFEDNPLLIYTAVFLGIKENFKGVFSKAPENKDGSGRGVS